MSTSKRCQVLCVECPLKKMMSDMAQSVSRIISLERKGGHIRAGAGQPGQFRAVIEENGCCKQLKTLAMPKNYSTFWRKEQVHFIELLVE